MKKDVNPMQESDFVSHLVAGILCPLWLAEITHEATRIGKGKNASACHKAFSPRFSHNEGVSPERGLELKLTGLWEGLIRSTRRLIVPAEIWKVGSINPIKNSPGDAPALPATGPINSGSS